MKIGYARVSTAEQCLDMQVRALREAGCVNIYTDDGVSAVAKERPKFKEALVVLRPGDTLYIWKLDRAFRSLLHALQVLEELEGRGVKFHSLTEAIDTTTPMGRFAYQITGAFAELERALIIERTKAGMEAARGRGVRIGRPRKLSEQQIAQARIRIVDDEAGLSSVAQELGVSPRTLSRALRGGFCA